MSRLEKDRKFLDEVRDVMRLHHYSIHTERTYCGWIKRYIQYHLTLKGTRFGYNFYELISLDDRAT
ncbi:MAG: phage integrase N-terminal SAM-like domain-containing protein [Deltaproteobacteria bacterium]|nr:phage integrase N-terminal SAM-like domain-containing protein [Deltaproteobacteria bacterium]